MYIFRIHSHLSKKQFWTEVAFHFSCFTSFTNFHKIASEKSSMFPENQHCRSNIIHSKLRSSFNKSVFSSCLPFIFKVPPVFVYPRKRTALTQLICLEMKCLRWKCCFSYFVKDIRRGFYENSCGRKCIGNYSCTHIYIYKKPTHWIKYWGNGHTASVESYPQLFKLTQIYIDFWCEIYNQLKAFGKEIKFTIWIIIIEFVVCYLYWHFNTRCLHII